MLPSSPVDDSLLDLDELVRSLRLVRSDDYHHLDELLSAPVASSSSPVDEKNDDENFDEESAEAAGSAVWMAHEEPDGVGSSVGNDGIQYWQLLNLHSRARLKKYQLELSIPALNFHSDVLFPFWQQLSNVIVESSNNCLYSVLALLISQYCSPVLPFHRRFEESMIDAAAYEEHRTDLDVQHLIDGGLNFRWSQSYIHSQLSARGLVAPSCEPSLPHVLSSSIQSENIETSPTYEYEKVSHLLPVIPLTKPSITYLNDSTYAVSTQHIHDVYVVMSSAALGGAYYYEFTVHEKSDEMWIGLTSNRSLFNNHGGMWCMNQCVSFYGGRESKIKSLAEATDALRRRNMMYYSLRDGAWGSLQIAGSCYKNYKLRSYSSGDRIGMYVDIPGRTVVFFHNDRKQITYDQLDITQPLFLFASLDEQNDAVSIRWSLSPPSPPPDSTAQTSGVDLSLDQSTIALTNSAYDYHGDEKCEIDSHDEASLFNLQEALNLNEAELRTYNEERDDHHDFFAHHVHHLNQMLDLLQPIPPENEENTML